MQASTPARPAPDPRLVWRPRRTRAAPHRGTRRRVDAQLPQRRGRATGARSARALPRRGRPHAQRLRPRGAAAFGDGNPDAWQAALRAWQAVGASHVSVNTMGRGFKTPGEHVTALRRFAEAVGSGPDPRQTTVADGLPRRGTQPIILSATGRVWDKAAMARAANRARGQTRCRSSVTAAWTYPPSSWRTDHS